MAYNTNKGKQSFTAIEGQTNFDINFKIYDDTDINVYLVPNGQTPNDITDILILGTDYTVLPTGDTGGVLTLLIVAHAGNIIVVQRRMEVVRETEYQTAGDLRAVVLNEDQDLQTYLISDNNFAENNVMRLQDTSTGVNTKLPAVVPGHFLRVNDLGTAFEFTGVDLNQVIQNTADILRNFNLITVNQQNIATNTGNISSNASNIAFNLNQINTNVASIAFNLVAIQQNTSDILTNTGNITSNTSNITLNVNNIALNTANIASNLASINANTASIISNTANIALNTTYVADNLGNKDNIQINTDNRGNVVYNLISDANYTLTAKQAQYGRIEITDIGTLLTAPRNITAGNIEHTFLFVNSTLFDLTVKTSIGTGVIVHAGTARELRNDTVNIIQFEAGSSAQVSVNTANIALNLIKINTNITDIATNLASINANTLSINSNTTNIALNTTEISDNTANITNIHALVNTNTANIATNITNINTNITNIADNTANIINVHALVNTNITNIALNLTKINTNIANIGSNTTDIATNTTNIATNTTDITANLTKINTNTANIAINTAKTTTNSTDINFNSTEINDNSIAIGTLQTEINSNTTKIENNKKQHRSITTNLTNDVNYTLNSNENQHGRIEITDTNNILISPIDIIVNNNEHFFLFTNSTNVLLTVRRVNGTTIVVSPNVSLYLVSNPDGIALDEVEKLVASNSALIAINKQGILDNTSLINQNFVDIQTNISTIDTNALNISDNEKKHLSVSHNITIDAEYVLTADQYKYGRIEISDNNNILTGTTVIRVGDSEHTFLFVNNTETELFVTRSSGSGKAVPRRTIYHFRNDTVNIIFYEGTGSLFNFRSIYITAILTTILPFPIIHTHITPFTISIDTRQSNSSVRIKVRWNGSSSGHRAIFGLTRNGITIGNPAPAGARSVGIASIRQGFYQAATYNKSQDECSFEYIDTPGNAGFYEYKMIVLVQGATAPVNFHTNRTIADLNEFTYPRLTSSMTLEEIGSQFIGTN